MDPVEVDAVDVLLVDDDVEWLALAGRSLEGADEAMTVLTAASGGEALELLDRESFDCVVCDYRMPGMDGLEVLDRVRADSEDLPFILVTASGSESVASSAISSAVTDYFVKDPGRDQSDTLAARVRSAVANHRTSEALASARRRFTGLFENVPSPVAIVDDEGGIYRVNDAFERTFGVHESNVEGLGIEVPVGTEFDLPTETDGATVETVALSTAEGEGYYVVRGFPLDDGSGYVGYAFTDVTDHRRRQEDLERALALDGEVRELLVSTSSKDRLERAFCETVVDAEGVVLAAVADRTADGGVAVRAAAGEPDPPVETTGDPAPTGGDGPVDPLAATLRDRTSRYVKAVEDDPAWSRRAGQAGVESVLTVPIERDGLPDGAFAVYADVADAFEKERRDRIRSLVDSLGDAVELVERMGALAADRVIRVRLTIAEGGPLARTAEDVGALDVRTVRRADEGARVYVEPAGDSRAVDRPSTTDARSGAGSDPVAALLADHDGVESVTTVDEGLHRYCLETTGRTVVDVVLERGGAVHSLRITPDATEATVDVPPTADVEAVVDAIESSFDGVDVHSIRTQKRGHVTEVRDDLGELTDKQREALETAYVEGYFEQPRARSAAEVAESMNISGSTFLQHLRAAQRKLLSSAFDHPDPSP